MDYLKIVNLIQKYHHITVPREVIYDIMVDNGLGLYNAEYGKFTPDDDYDSQTKFGEIFLTVFFETYDKPLRRVKLILIVEPNGLCKVYKTLDFTSNSYTTTFTLSFTHEMTPHQMAGVFTDMRYLMNANGFRIKIFHNDVSELKLKATNSVDTEYQIYGGIVEKTLTADYTLCGGIEIINSDELNEMEDL